MSDKSKNNKKYGDDFRDVSIIKRQAWLQNQVPWKKEIRKDKKWRKSPNRSFRPKNTEVVEPDPYRFRCIPSDISEVLKNKRLNLGLSVQNLAFKSNVHIDKIMNFEDRQNSCLFLSNYELYKINYILENYSSLKDVKNIKIPLPEGILSGLSNL
jgi:hypothetical protein